MNRCARAMVTLGLTAVMLMLVGCSGGSTTITTAPSEHVVTVTAQREVKVVPDVARIGVSVTTQGATAEDVQSDNTEKVRAVVAALHDAGVADGSIQTTSADQYPLYDEVSGGGENGIGNVSSARAAYEMTTRIEVSGLAIDQVGAVMQACVEAGATGTDGPEYYSSDYDTAYQEALNAALDDARAKAEFLAKASKVTLGSVTNVTEGYQDTSYRASSDEAMVQTAPIDSASELVPGEVSVEAVVTVSYAIS